MKYPHIAAKLFNVPLIVRPETAFVFADAFIQVLGGNVVVGPAGDRPDAPERESFAWSHAGPQFKEKKYPVTASGVGILPIYGPLVQRAGQITPDCTEMTSYERLSRRFDMMLADPDVKAILLELDSPGGEVAGNFEFARRVRAAAGTKPVWAHANEMAYSGGYSIGAAAQKLMVPDTGGVGSIGVILMHMSQADRDAKMGYRYTAIYAGARKNDFNPHEALTPEARAVAEAYVQRDYELFVQHVATMRGIDPKAVRATEAGLLDPDAAKRGGFVDDVATFAETLARLENFIQSRNSFSTGAAIAAQQPAKETQMKDADKAAPGTDKPAQEQPKATTEPGKPGLDANAVVELIDQRAAERERVSAILGLPEAKDRPSLAQHLALGTSMSLEESKAALVKAAPEIPAKSGANQFATAMADLGNPKVGVGSGDPPSAPQMETANDIYARRRAARTGVTS